MDDFTWTRATAAEYTRMLEVLPPADWRRGMFLVGEASDHEGLNGAARYRVYRERGDEYAVGSRPVSLADFDLLVALPPAPIA